MSDHLEDVRPMFELRGRNYVVTGGAQGIGFAVTRAICEMGGNVAVMDIQEKPVNATEWANLSQRFGAKAVYIQTDVTKQESLNAAFARAVQELGSLDGLVPAAGIAIDKPFVDQTWEEFTRIQEINVRCLRRGPRSEDTSLTLMMPNLGQRHIFRGSAGNKAILIAKERRQHRPHCLTVEPHCAARLVSLPIASLTP
jgi:NAD(P)-dependent dehydrogenase (short-subunit alcohol dehydrogenase family)